ncbi:baseplate assembly protein [Cohaesibacter marisflavi]|uniref:baseplate assembly protein n=1 Tax=Cohaesibacter marisflavi TaxID=655353 RepID=UPI0029C87BA6|nr:baseplate assembly protein [Cohaesibacter marisflavi]
MDSLVGMKIDIEMLKSVLGQSLKVGTVAKLDADKGYRIALGEDDDGDEFLSPWMPHPETSKSSVPLEEGQTVGIIAPSGDLSQGVLIRGGYSKGKESPNSDLAANVFKDAGVTVTVKSGALRIETNGVTVVISGSGFAVEGGGVTHNGVNIGDDHKHTDVVAGPDLTGPPQG